MGFKSTTKATTTTDCSQTFACWSLALTQVLKQLSPASAMIILAVQYEKHAEILRHYFEEISAETTYLLTFLEEKYSASVADTIARGSPTTTAASAARSQTCGQLTTDNNDLTAVLEDQELYFDEVSLSRLWNLRFQDAATSSRSVIKESV